MNKSTHRVEIVPVKLELHPSADTLSIVRIFGGFTCCVRTADWQGIEYGAYIPPDSVVDSTRPEFAFLAGHERIKVKRLRGIISMGLLIPAPDGAQLGDDVADLLNVIHYEPPMPLSAGGEIAAPPAGWHPVFDVDSLRRYADKFVSGEKVFITEKIHGANSRFCFADDRMHCGSRTEWKKEAAGNLWWRVLVSTSSIESFCKANPDCTLYGEVYGSVQELKYGLKPGDVRFAAFDILRGSEWLNAHEANDLCLQYGVPFVPVVESEMLFDLDRVLALAEGKSLIADHVREGIVVKPLIERADLEIGRVCLKVVGNGYLEKA